MLLWWIYYLKHIDRTWTSLIIGYFYNILRYFEVKLEFEMQFNEIFMISSIYLMSDRLILMSDR